jgi:hypothetical protein
MSDEAKTNEAKTNAVGNTGFLSEMDIRVWLRDADPAANILLDDYEFSNEEIRTAATLAVDYWNESLPNIKSYELYDFPYRHALLQGTCANLLRMAANRYRRNDLQYQTGGGVVSDQNKYQQYEAAAAPLWKEFTSWVALKKRSINMSIGWGCA